MVPPCHLLKLVTFGATCGSLAFFKSFDEYSSLGICFFFFSCSFGYCCNYHLKFKWMRLVVNGFFIYGFIIDFSLLFVTGIRCGAAFISFSLS
jgi:hypothetical protein